VAKKEVATSLERKETEKPMRLALVSLLALTVSANAFAQSTATTPEPAPAPTPAPTPGPAVAPPTPAPGPAAAPTPAPSPTADTATAPVPPPPPTDPAAVAMLTILQKVCIPAANGGDFNQLVKAAGLRKAGDIGWNLRQKDFTLVVVNPGSNPSQCHVNLTHPADLESPGRPIIIALNDWAGITNGWSLYRNDKSVQQGLQFTTRSWQLDWNGTEQSLVFTTKRKPDGSPLHTNADESEMIYGVVKTG
jgi:hypothetical protein